MVDRVAGFRIAAARDLSFNAIMTICGNCGQKIARWEAICGYCGAPNPGRRRMVIAVAASVVLGLAAIAVGVVLFAGNPFDRSGIAVSQPDGTDFGWLETAMKQCDEQAAKESAALHYLVIPLVDEPRDEAGWRRVSLNDIGNAILIGSEDMLAGLRRKALRISTDQYVFSARNENTKDILTWKPSKGVRKFVISDASEIKLFRIQFQSTDVGRAINWGATFERKAGDCNWVNAILRH